SLPTTKSVSQFTSISTASLPDVLIDVVPSAATLSAFLAALAAPLFRRTSIAPSISPSVSVNAFLQSIIPAPVFSRNSLTIFAVTAMIYSSHLRVFISKIFLKKGDKRISSYHPRFLQYFILLLVFLFQLQIQFRFFLRQLLLLL